MDKFTFIMGCILLGAVHSVENWGQPEEEDVTVLTTKTFDDFLKSHNVVMVEFYAPWCGHCKQLAPKYSKLAKMMKESDPAVPIAKVDATKEEELATRFNVEGYPTIKVFVNGNPSDYQGERETESMANFLKKKAGPATTEVLTADDLTKLKASPVAVLLHLHKDEHKTLEEFNNVARDLHELPFAFTHDQALLKDHKLDKKFNLIVFRNFDENPVIASHDELDAKAIRKIVDAARFPLVGIFDEAAANRIFSEEKSAIFFFTDKPDSKETDIFRSAAKASTHDVVFSISQISEGLGQKLAEYVGFNKSHEGKLLLITVKAGKIAKYACDDYSEQGIAKCLQDLKDFKLKQLFKSDPLPEKNDEPVKVIVGKNFEEIVLDPKKHVLLEVYAPWCGHCQKLAPIYEELAKKLQSRDDIVIAKMDGTTNEVDGVDVEGFPTLKWFGKDDKKAVDFDEARTLKGFLRFIEQKLSIDLGSKEIEDSKEDQGHDDHDHDHDHGAEEDDGLGDLAEEDGADAEEDEDL